MTDRDDLRALHVDLYLSLSDPWLTAEKAALLKEQLEEFREVLDWGWLVDRAARHKVLPLIGFQVKKFRLHRNPVSEGRLIPYPWLVLGAYEENRRCDLAQRAEFGGILRAVAESGVPYAVRKGPVLSEHLYPDPGTRRMTDLDLLVTREDAAVVGEVLEKAGYAQGTLAEDGGSVEPFSRETRMFWSVNVANALPYVRPADSPHVEGFEVDLCLDLTPAAGDGAGARTRGFLERAVPVEVCGVAARRLSPADELLDLCVHLHKEADARHYIAIGGDLTLSKFIDVACSVARADGPTRDRFVALATGSGVLSSVFFALHYTRELYPDAVPAELVRAVAPADRSVLTEYGHLEGRPVAWTSTFHDRLFGSRERTEAADARPLPQY